MPYNKKDFPMLEKDIIYLDNSATTLKPYTVIDKTNDYYKNYSANAFRGDYDIAEKVDEMIAKTRSNVRSFINAKRNEEIIFTSGTTESLNIIAFGFMKEILEKDDEIILSQAEHASNVLPWFRLQEEIGVVIKFVPLDDEYKVTLENLKKVVTPKTRVIALAHVTNVIADVRPIKEITEFAHENNIMVVVDGAQSVPHIKTDVDDLDIDFLAFSAHKMCGPTGVGVLYAKYGLLNRVKPLELGGGMNLKFDSEGNVELKELPMRLEPGTPNIAGIIAFNEAIEYINDLGNIHEKEVALRKYLVEKLEVLEHIEVYNPKSDGPVVVFNVKGIFCEDVAMYLNKFNICIRAGAHCSKMTKEILPVTNTCRVSLYFYNTYEEIDKLVDVLKNKDDIIHGMI